MAYTPFSQKHEERRGVYNPFGVQTSKSSTSGGYTPFQGGRPEIFTQPIEEQLPELPEVVKDQPEDFASKYFGIGKPGLGKLGEFFGGKTEVDVETFGAEGADFEALEKDPRKSQFLREEFNKKAEQKNLPISAQESQSLSLEAILNANRGDYSMIAEEVSAMNLDRETVLSPDNPILSEIYDRYPDEKIKFSLIEPESLSTQVRVNELMKMSEEERIAKSEEALSLDVHESLPFKEKAIKLGLLPIKYTAGTIANYTASLGLEIAGSDLKYIPETDLQEWLVSDTPIERLYDEEFTYGFKWTKDNAKKLGLSDEMAANLGIGASLVVAGFVENPFLAGIKGSSSVFRESIITVLEKETGQKLSKEMVQGISKDADNLLKLDRVVDREKAMQRIIEGNKIKLGVKELPPLPAKKLVEKATVPAKPLKTTIKPYKPEEYRKLTDQIKKEEKLAIQLGKSERNKVRKELGLTRKKLELGSNVPGRIKEVIGVDDFKRMSKEQLSKSKRIIDDLKKGDSFLTPKQIEGLDDYLKTFKKDKRLVTKREIIERFAENDALADTYINPYILPTVDIKESSKVIRKIVDKADYEMRLAVKKGTIAVDTFESTLKRAEKTRSKGVKKWEVREKIFKYLGGEDIKLSKEEVDAAKVMQEYFEKAKKDIDLTKFRKNYVTHLEKDLYEKIVSNDWDYKKILNSYKTKDGNIPIDIIMNLDHIIGSEKFFRFGMKRTGGIDPTTNLRRIFRTYVKAVEEKKALDLILPEGQAAVQLLLEGKSQKWMADWMKNLKGRGLDYNMRQKMPLVAKATDKIIDFGYIRLLAGNYWSAFKNIMGGEVNSFVFQSFDKYLTGKKRLIVNPKRSYGILKKAGVMDGTYVDVVEQTLSGKTKKAVDVVAYGGMTAAEYEIRGSLFLGEMTKKEWLRGEVSSQRFREIMDKVAVTQGVYTKVDSPLFVQTTMGRALAQFGRWKITNLALTRRAVKGVNKEIKAGVYNGKNMKTLMKIIGVYAAGSYLSFEAGKAGYKETKKVIDAGLELANLLLNLPEEFHKAMVENPAWQFVDSILYTAQGLMQYVGGEEPKNVMFRNGVNETYWSALKTLGVDQNKKKGTGTSIKGLPKLPNLPDLPDLPSL